ncbi:MAG: FecR domain-containing protein [Pedobacter sp.]|uniref:FecR family protein n=1 Tax=Pedobacter sp. TaxID=1411316 RepID=UPI00339865EC
MDYLKFGVEDFLCDNSFLEYCLETNPEAVKFWKEWLNENPGKAPEVNNAREIFHTLNGNISAENFHNDHSVFTKALRLKLEEEGAVPTLPDSSLIQKRNKVRRLWITTASVAACILLGIGFFLFSTDKTKIAQVTPTLSYSTPMGKKKVIKLPDGSVVTLNGGSHVRLHPEFNKGNRELNLTGEAYFVVIHNAAKPFVVHTRKITIRDVGTEFNVKAYPSDKITEASLIKGLIEITIQEGTQKTVKSKPIMLSPNTKFIFRNDAVKEGHKNNVIKPVFNVRNITTTEDHSVAETDWTQNKLTFVDEPLSEMAAQMERWYGVKVVIANPALNNLRFTATFDHGDIIQILEALKLSGNFNYRKEDNMISIY